MMVWYLDLRLILNLMISKKALKLIEKYDNLYLIGMQCHFATRRLDTWKPRAQGMLRLLDNLGITPDI